jgi:hypothetical protein
MPDFYTHSSGFTASREQILARHRLVAARYLPDLLCDRDLADYRAPQQPVTLPMMENHDG